MKKFKYVIITMLLSAMILTSASFSSLAESSTDTSIQNPYVQQYNKEKTEKLNNQEIKAQETAIASQQDVEVVNVLNAYYNEDVKVSKILNKFTDDTKLINKVTSLIKEDKIEIMHYIMMIYDSVQNQSDKECLLSFFEKYARNSEDAESVNYLKKFVPETDKTSINIDIESEKKIKNNETSITTSSSISTPISASSYMGTYSGASAATWAYNNYNKYSTSFPNLTAPGSGFSDCTNFVSQAMYLGGAMQMQSDWYCFKKNASYLVPVNVTQLNYSWTLKDPSPWISVKEFASFWSTRASGNKIYSHAEYEANHDAIFTSAIYRGDIVILRTGVAGWVTVASHAMIISGYSSATDDFLLSAHSSERRDYPLLSAITNYDEVQILSY